MNLPEAAYSVELVKVRNSHRYRVIKNGIAKEFDGVTGALGVIAKPALIGWSTREALKSAADALRLRVGQSLTIDDAFIDAVMADARKKPESIKTEAAELGTLAHAFIDEIIHGREPKDIPAAIRAPVLAFTEWWFGSGFDLVAGDTKVASWRYSYGGSLDAVGRRGNHLVILDWKTSNGIWPEYALQVAAYAQAFEETYGLKPQEGIVVRFSKTEPIEFETKRVDSLPRSFAAFHHALELKRKMAEAQFEEKQEVGL